jgi:ribosomal protein S18 acetylase RimI-like enzyme
MSAPTVAPGLYERQARSLVASWAGYATASDGAAVYTDAGADIGVFPSEPERSFYNNALMSRGRDVEANASALDAIEARYARARIDSYAVWIHESDAAAIGVAERRCYRVNEWTRAMAMSLDDLAVDRPVVDLGDPDWGESLRIMRAPDGLLRNMEPNAFHVLVGRLDGRNVATAIAYDSDGDCGIYNAVTVPEARRRGLGTALTALHLHDARDRGCTTASLQSTPVAERVYASLGFRDLGRYLEYVP